MRSPRRVRVVAAGVAAVAIVASAGVAFASIRSNSKTAGSGGRYVEIGMPFDGYFGRFSGAPDVHTQETAKFRLWGDWAEDLYPPAPGGEVRLVASAPNGGTVTLKQDSSYGPKGSCDGAAGQRVVVDVLLDGTKMGSVYYEHLDGAVHQPGNPTVTPLSVIGRTKMWPQCSAWQVRSPEGTHTHFEMKSTSAGSACWYPHPPAEQLKIGTPIGRIGGTGTAGSGQKCPQPPITPPTAPRPTTPRPTTPRPTPPPSPTPRPTPPPTAAQPTQQNALEVGSRFAAMCTIAWPTAPSRSERGIQMTTFCPAVMGSYQFVQIFFADSNLAVSPSRASMDVEGRVVDITKSEYGYRELLIVADSVRLR